MAPGVRGGRADVGGERTARRAGAAGMLCAGMLLLFARCASAAEDKSTYDASGSSSLPSDPVVTAAPARPSAGQSLAEEVPFSVIRSGGGSESEGEGLSRQPAFSSVLTVMAGAVSRPVSLDESRTSPTVTRDETHTTQWPSHSLSRGSETSSSLYAGDRILSASSGLTSSVFHQLSPRVVPTPSNVARRSTLSSPSPSSPSSPLSTSNPATSSVSPSPVSSRAERIKKAASPRGQTLVSSPDPLTEAAALSPAGSPGRTDSLTATQAAALSLPDLPAVAQGLESTAAETVPSEASTQQSNNVTKHSIYSSASRINGASESLVTSATATATKNSAYTSSYALRHKQTLFTLLHGPTQTQDPGLGLVSASNREIITSFPSGADSQAAQRQQVASPVLTPALQSARLEGDSVSSHDTQQMSSGDSRAHVRSTAGDTTMSPPASHVVNSAVSPAATSRPTGSLITVSSEAPPGRASFFDSAITELTPIHSGAVSSEHASNPGDLPMAAGHRSPRSPAINTNYDQGATAGDEIKPISTRARQNNSLSLTRWRPESTRSSIFSLNAGSETSTSDSGSPGFLANGVANKQDFEAQTRFPKGTTQEPPAFASDTETTYPSGSALAARLANDMSYKTSPVRTYLLPTSVTNGPNHDTGSNAGTSANNVADFVEQSKALLSPHTTASTRASQTRSLLMFSHVFNATPPSRARQTGSSAEGAAFVIEPEDAGRSIHSTFGVETSAGNKATPPPPPSSDGVSHDEGSAGSIRLNPARSSLDASEEPAMIRDTVFYNTAVPSEQLTTQIPSFITTKGVYAFNRSSEGSPSEAPYSPVGFDVALEALKSRFPEHDVTTAGRYQQSSPSSWSGIISAPRANSASGSQGPTVSVSSHTSKLYLGRRATKQVTASSAAATSPSDRQNGAIFSFGTKLMAPYTKWKATRLVPFQSGAFESENTSTSSDRANSILAADGPSYEHPKPGSQREHNVRMLNSTGPAAVASDSYSPHPTDGVLPSLMYVKGTSRSEEQSLNLSPADHRSAWGSHGFLTLSHVTSDAVMSSQGTAPAWAYGGDPSLAGDAAVTLSNSPAHSFSGAGSNSSTTAYKGNGLTSHIHLARSSSSSLPFSPSSLLSSSSKPLSVSLSGAKGYQVTSSVSPEAADTSRHPGTASLHVEPLPPMFLSSSLGLMPSAHSDSLSHQVTDAFVVPTEAATDESNLATSRAVALTFPKEKEASLVPSELGRITLSAGPTERTSQVPPLSPRRDTTTASVKLATTTVDSATKTKSPATDMPSLSVTTGPTQSTAATTTTTTTTPKPQTRRSTTTMTIRTQTSRRAFTPPVPRTTPPRGAVTNFVSPFITTTEVPPQQCNITERLWVKTVVSIYVRRNRLDSIQRQNLRRGLSQGLRKALNDTSAQAQVETVFGSPNMTVAYHVTGGDTVYPPSVVLEGLESYGRDKLIADLRQFLPMVTALPLPVALWRPVPAAGFQLKTVLQFVGAGDDPRSCRFSQMMEQRLEKVFSEAQAKALNTNSRLSVQMLSVSQAPGSAAVSLVYTVRNGTVFLNGTAASNLLGQLSAELVGYFLFYPPLVIAEPLEYHNLNTSVATRDFWVITVIQDVDNASLEAQYQSFASVMEQRLAELFVLASQQGTRFRRATAVGSYTVQMVSIRRVTGSKNPAEMTYYIQHNGVPLSGSSAAKILNTVDSQTMALTLGYFVQLQAEPVVKNPPNNLWIIAAVLAPIAVVTLIIIIITAVLCRKNKNDFKADAIGNLNPRAKMAYRRDVGYYHQPVQGFDYAKQHLGQQGGDEETLPVSQDTLVMSLQIRDQPLSLEKALQQDGTANRKSLTADKHKSKLPSEDGSVISNESEKPNSGRGLTVPKVTAQQKLAKEATRKRDDPYDTSSGSLQLISIKPVAAQPNYSHPALTDRGQDVAIINGEVNLALKQKSDIEHYRNKLRLKAKRKGYYDFPSTDGSSSGPAPASRQRHGHERAAGEHGRPLEPDDERGSTYVKSHRRHSQVGQAAYRSRQSLSSPSPGGTEMDLLVMRERPRRGIRNSGYDTEPELIEETNVDRLMGPRAYMYGRGLKGHSETSTLSSQPSIDEVRQQMHLLLEEAFSLASGGQSTSGRHSHPHHQHHPTPDHYNPAPPPLPYADVVTSAPGTMSSGRGGLQWVPSYGADIYQCSLPKPAFRFTQLPEIAVGSPPPLPPRTGPSSGTSLRRSTSDLGLKGRNSKTSVTEMQSQHDNNPYGPNTRAALPSITAEQPVSNYSGNPITAVYAIPAARSGYSEYFVSTPPTSYHSPSWMSYPPEPEDVPPQWADSVPLPGYVEAFPHPRYPQGSPTRLPLEYNQSVEQPTVDHNAASQQSLPQSVKNMDSMPLSSLSTSALVQAIRQEVAKLAKKQNDMFEF